MKFGRSELDNFAPTETLYPEKGPMASSRQNRNLQDFGNPAPGDENAFEGEENPIPIEMKKNSTVILSEVA